MKLIVVQTQKEGAQVAFDLLEEALAQGAQTLGLATGSTPLEFYRRIVASDLDFSQLTSINLDEYVGLCPEHTQSYHYFMQEMLFKFKPFKSSILPNGLAEDLTAEITRYNHLIENHPIDFQILGLGRNGHIGFNEPGTSFASTTHVVDLTESTLAANARFFDHADQVPKQAISMGIASIMKAKTIVLMAYGMEKAEAVKLMVQGPVSEQVPASILQKHPRCIVIVDDAAASLLD